MSLITSPPAEYITVGGKEYKINTDYRVWIQVEQLLKSLKDSPEETYTRILTLCFTGDGGERLPLPKTWKETIEAIFAFYTANAEKPNEKEQRSVGEKAQRIYDFEYDGDYIWAAIMQQYGIDISEMRLHWWKFKALFSSITSDTKMGKIMEYRAVDLSSISDRKMKSQYMRLKEIFALPDNRSEDEKEQDFADALFNL